MVHSGTCFVWPVRRNLLRSPVRWVLSLPRTGVLKEPAVWGRKKNRLRMMTCRYTQATCDQLSLGAQEGIGRFFKGNTGGGGGRQRGRHR